MVKDAPRVKVATWVRPRFVVQVAFTEWTGDNRLRHPSFLGMRDDKSVKEVVREKPVPAPVPAPVPGKPRKRSRGGSGTGSGSGAGAGSVKLTHPERILYPK